MFFEPGAHLRSVEPIEEKERDESLEEAQGTAHERGGIEVVVGEEGDGADGGEERPEEDDEARHVASLPVLPDEYQFDDARTAEKELLEDGAGGVRSAHELEQALEELNRDEDAQSQRGEADALGAGGLAFRALWGGWHHAESIADAMGLECGRRIELWHGKNRIVVEKLEATREDCAALGSLALLGMTLSN